MHHLKSGGILVNDQFGLREKLSKNNAKCTLIHEILLTLYNHSEAADIFCYLAETPAHHRLNYINMEYVQLLVDLWTPRKPAIWFEGRFCTMFSPTLVYP